MKCDVRGQTHRAHKSLIFGLRQMDSDTVKRTILITDLKTDTKLQTAWGFCGQRTHPVTNRSVCLGVLIVGDLIAVTGVSISSSFCRDDKCIPMIINTTESKQ